MPYKVVGLLVAPQELAVPLVAVVALVILVHTYKYHFHPEMCNRDQIRPTTRMSILLSKLHHTACHNVVAVH
jgi:hypothetical protein